MNKPTTTYETERANINHARFLEQHERAEKAEQQVKELRDVLDAVGELVHGWVNTPNIERVSVNAFTDEIQALLNKESP